MSRHFSQRSQAFFISDEKDSYLEHEAEEFVNYNDNFEQDSLEIEALHRAQYDLYQDEMISDIENINSNHNNQAMSHYHETFVTTPVSSSPKRNATFTSNFISFCDKNGSRGAGSGAAVFQSYNGHANGHYEKEEEDDENQENCSMETNSQFKLPPHLVKRLAKQQQQKSNFKTPIRQVPRVLQNVENINLRRETFIKAPQAKVICFFNCFGYFN